MAGSVHTEAYRALLAALVALRDEAGLSQAALAVRLGKPASFVGKYELGERRLDAIEFMIILQVLEADFAAFWQRAGIVLPDRL